MTFNSGVQEGEKLIKFLREIALAWDDLAGFERLKFGCTKNQMAYYWGNFPLHKPTDEMIGFLQTIVPNEFADYGVIKLMPFNDMANYNDEYAPLCNFSKDIGFAGFAYWTGDSDGDAWCFDLNSGSICSINVGEYQETYNEIYDRAYAKSKSISDWRLYLINEAIEREWITHAVAERLA